MKEDIGAGDITTHACVPESAAASGEFIAKQELVVAGIELLPIIYSTEIGGALSTPPVKVHFAMRFATGAKVPKGEVVAALVGSAQRLLERERVALNFVQHLSGIATLTRRFVDAVDGTGAVILDTRKTTPGWRRLEKLAVAAGGGQNHRMGLWDAVLIKENHVKAAGGIRAAVAATRKVGAPVEIEVRDRNELHEALEAGAARILLDNMTPGEVRECVAMARAAEHPPQVEVSGGVTLDNVREYALAGPDYISVGALTHSAPAADISFLIDEIKV